MLKGLPTAGTSADRWKRSVRRSQVQDSQIDVAASKTDAAPPRSQMSRPSSWRIAGAAGARLEIACRFQLEP